MVNPKAMVRLLRLPLALTAVADIVAGYTVALLGSRVAGDWQVGPTVQPPLAFDWERVALLAGVAAGLYLFGMVQNDLVDIRRDALLKRNRPIATGEISIGAAVALLLMTGGLAALCVLRLPGEAVLLAVAAFAAINLYNLAAKRGPAYITMAVMGLCRLLNFGIGVAAAIGAPRGQVGWDMLMPWGPMWARHAAAVFFVSAMASGYSCSARWGQPVSTRPWQGVLLLTLGAGVVMWELSIGKLVWGATVIPPLARVFALLALPALWPGRLWSPLGSERKPETYEPFVERLLYWLILLDAAFVIDALLTVSQATGRA